MKVRSLQLADPPPIGSPEYKITPFREAIHAARSRGVVLPDTYYGKLQGVARSHAFSIAGVSKLAQLQGAAGRTWGARLLMARGLLFGERVGVAPGGLGRVHGAVGVGQDGLRVLRPFAELVAMHDADAQPQLDLRSAGQPEGGIEGRQEPLGYFLGPRRRGINATAHFPPPRTGNLADEPPPPSKSRS